MNFNQLDLKPNLKKSTFSFLIFVMVLSVFTSSHVVLVDTLAARVYLQVFMVTLSLIFILMSANKPINKNAHVVFLLIFTSLLGEIIYRHRFSKIAGYLLAIGLVYIVVVMGRKKIIRFINMVNIINTFLALLGLVALVLSFKYSAVSEALYMRAPYYNNALPSGSAMLSFLGHADTYQNLLGIANTPRLSAHLQQASLIPAYFLIPLGISLAYSRVKPLSLVIITLFILSTFGGTAYFAVIVAVLVFLFGKFIPRQIFVVFPFVLLVVFLFISVFIFCDRYDLENIKEMGRIASTDVQYWGTINNWPLTIINRAASSLSRISLIAFAAIEMLHSFPFPSGRKILEFTVGSNVITSGLRGGFLGLLASISMYYCLFHKISYELISCRSVSRSRMLGFSLIYSLIFQSFVYNDFGFSTYYGFVMWACILVLADKRQCYYPSQLKTLSQSGQTPCKV